MLNIGAEVEAVVSDVNVPNRRISLSLKALEQNPWDTIAERYPVGAVINGQGPQPHRLRRVRRGRGGHRRTDSHLRHVVEPPPQASQRGAEEGRHGAGARDQRRRREPAAVALDQASSCPNEWDNFAKDAQRRRRGGRHGLQDHRLRSVHPRWPTAWKGWRTCPRSSATPKVKLDKVFQLGEPVRARIIKIDPDERKIGLSTRDVEPLTEPRERAEVAGTRGQEQAGGTAAEYQASWNRKGRRPPGCTTLGTKPDRQAATALSCTIQPRKSRAGVFFFGAFSGCLVVFVGLSLRLSRRRVARQRRRRAPLSSGDKVADGSHRRRDRRVRATRSRRCTSYARQLDASKRSSCASTVPAARSRHRRRSTPRSAACARDSGKPIVASLDSVAASGGYYIAVGLRSRSSPIPARSPDRSA